ncbi:Sodium, potassium, lithium and rubidium/H(+) antiporter [Chryseobacterium sp. MOF25P]|uniref:Na+/H+ antiporter n=1 Tax=unclassified Chryseobacterium TaxID=2593645 RepID=UPI00080553D4|nr:MULTISPECIES: Na+/H+ antiporter [unclassified Chryseobacterium]OBW41046.1 Sodium, potassium, lithium and rubidium/H(+) antiporter [Chryseobacterium sp. MOF25P]OBW43785.1 Sodium, potassium, lithium and rubidium/H(+) antiporter [Chryseobacterium sp. BGARF1]
MHSLLPFLLAMVAVIVVLNMFAAKLKIAYPILLVVGGLIISFIPGLPVIKIDPDLIFFIFLPPLLCDAAWNISFKEMMKWWRIIGSFAFLVVFFTALSVALITNYFIPGFTIALGFLLGGIVSPPDAVSTGAITKFVKIPKSTSTILEGESLLNDASSLIIFRFALVAVGTGQFIWMDATMSFFWMVIGGVGIGLLLGWLFVKAHKLLPTDAPSDIALTIIEPYLMYWIAEQFHSSGVLAVVAGGLFMSARRLKFLNSTSRIHAYSVWESLIFILNGVVFLIIGLELPEIVDGLKEDQIPLETAIGYGILVTGILIAARMISSYAALISTMIFRPSVQPHASSRTRRWMMPLLLGWTGMRGVVSLAAALAIPVTLDNGEAFPHRNLILFITFVVILLTLLVQGLTLPYFIKRTRFFDDVFKEESEELTKQKLKKDLKQHVYHFLKTKYENELKDHAGLEIFLRHWEERAKAADDSWMNEKTKLIFIEMLETQREYLSELNKDPKINEEIIRQQLFQIDLEEERLRMI